MKHQGVLALSSRLLVALPLRMAGVAEHCWYTYCGTSALNEPGWNCNGGGFPGGGGPGGGGGSGNGGCRGCGTGGDQAGFWPVPQVEPHYEAYGPGSSGMTFLDWANVLDMQLHVPYGAGAQGGACPDEQCSAAGMPAWWISEPYVSLHVEDEPLGYQPALGPRVSFHLAYRQRGNVAVESGVFGVGTNWTCSFRAWLTASNGYAYVHRGGAGVVRYGVGQSDFRDGTVVAWEDNVGWVLETRTGAKAVFGTLVTIGQSRVGP